jgi:hypothetical protein
MSEVINTGDKKGIKLEEYNGVYSLSAYQENKGKFWAVWAKYHKGSDYQEKDWPVKVTLGDRATAEGVLLMILKEITGDEYIIKPDDYEQPKPPPQSECPF